ncbi:MAG: response regulator [Anaerolineaceae bacterium]|nr:response regulator [Anaerolineaceae bacterium]
MSHQPNILVVEDRADWQGILYESVLREGYTPHPATSYEEALNALGAKKFDLAIVDPVLDMGNRFNREGLSVVEKIRKIEPEMPVVIITGSFTRDMKASLQQLSPNSPVLFKENWDPVAFSNLIHEFVGEQTGLEPPAGTLPRPGQSSKSASHLTPPPERAVNAPRVLIVENREDWQNIVAAALDEAGCFWRLAQSAQEALLELERESFHLVILDLKLQKVNLPLSSSEGWLLLDHLIEVQPNTKVVILSGQASPGDVADLLKNYPIIDFIEKQRFTSDAIRKAVEQATQAPVLRIQTFGQFRLWRDGKLIEGWERPQAETIVKLLLIRRARAGRAVPADELITRLWPDSDELSGRKKLLPLISNARRTLEPDSEPRDSNFIIRTVNGYFFELSGQVTWDLIEFRQHLRQGRDLIRAGQWTEAIIELKRGCDLYQGDFLAENRYDDWAINIRREIMTEFRDLLVLLADAYAALGRYQEAIGPCELALQKDPMLESAYRRLMRYHACNHDKGQALKVYRDCLTLFEELFGESPTPATRRLYEAIANDEPLDCEAKE